jgi:SAM-dependent MidA family methyltransferase
MKETVETFMTRALYDAEAGYYTRHIRTVGRHGDFATAATLSETLGRALGRWVVDRRKRHEVAAVIEVGGGTGSLALAVLRGIAFWRRWNLNYHMVEISPPLRRQQEKNLRGHRVCWHETMESALAACAGQAVIFSNELVDAFPCRQLEWRGGDWKEVAWDPRTSAESGANGPREILQDLPASFDRNAHAWLQEGHGWREGQRVEIHPRYRQWLRSWMPHWARGTMLTIDYGAPAHPRPRFPLTGTLRGYFQQHRIEGEELYRRVGRQDLTADVCFTDLKAWGEDAGLLTRHLSTQAAWLAEWGPGILDRQSADHDAGGAFWVLEQERSGAPHQ